MRTRFPVRSRQRSDLYGVKPRPERYERAEREEAWNGNSLRGASNMSVCGTVRWENAATWQNSIVAWNRVPYVSRDVRVFFASVLNSVGALINVPPPRYEHTRAHTHTWIHGFLGVSSPDSRKDYRQPSSIPSHPIASLAATPRNCFRWVCDVEHYSICLYAHGEMSRERRTTARRSRDFAKFRLAIILASRNRHPRR